MGSFFWSMLQYLHNRAFYLEVALKKEVLLQIVEEIEDYQKRTKSPKTEDSVLRLVMEVVIAGLVDLLRTNKESFSAHIITKDRDKSFYVRFENGEYTVTGKNQKPYNAKTLEYALQKLTTSQKSKK